MKLLLTCLVLSLALVFASSSQAEPKPTIARDVLAELPDKTAVLDSLPNLLPICHPASPSVEVCTWNIGRREPAWERIAGLVPTRERVHLVCFFHPTGGDQHPDCTVFAAVRKLDRGSSVDDSRNAFRKEQLHRVAAARTITEMSILMGTGPDLCVLLGPSRRRCQWRTNRATPGFLILSTAIGSRSAIRLTCTFPVDGTPRESDSCEIFPLD